MAISIRAKIDSELTRRIGQWFTVREIQDKLNVSQSTLKPLIMKYARENVLRRRHVKGTARSVQFSPAAKNQSAFHSILVDLMPYRSARVAKSQKAPTKQSASRLASPKAAKKSAAKKTAKRSTKSTARKSSKR